MPEPLKSNTTESNKEMESKIASQLNKSLEFKPLPKLIESLEPKPLPQLNEFLEPQPLPTFNETNIDPKISITQAIKVFLFYLLILKYL